MTTTTSTAAVVALLVVLAIVWRRRQRWRRRPWLEKLRAQAESKIEKERSELREPTRKERPVEVRDVAVKRPKERRKRGKEPKPSRMTSSKREVDNCPERVVPELSSSCPSRPQSPHRIPLPPSPLVSAQVIPPSLVLSSPASPSSLGISPELIITTPTSPSLLEPNQKPDTPLRKLPAFPPASPLPPVLARKQPPLARRPTPTVSRKPSVTEPEFPTAKREDEPGRKRKPSDVRKKGTPEATQIASLKGALEAARLREEEVAEERKAWQKRERDLQTQVNQLAHQLHALSIACGAYGYGYGGAEPTGQPTTASNVDQSMMPMPLPPLNTSLPITPNTLSVPPNTLPPNTLSPNGLPIPNPTLAPSTPTLGPSICPMPFPPFPYMNSHVHGSPMPHGVAIPPHSPLPPHASSMQPAPHSSPMTSHGTPIPHGTSMQPMPPRSPMNFGMMPMMSPPPQHAGPISPQSPFVVHPWNVGVRGASPMHMGAGSSMHPGAYAPPGGSPMHMNATSPMHMTGPGRPPFFTGSPRRSRSPYVPHARQGTPSTPSVGSVDDTGRRSVDGGRSSIGSTGRRSVDSTDRPVPDRRLSLKREREPETESESSSDEDSDDDSVIFEDGSVTDSLNLSLLGESLPKVESPTKFDSGEIPSKFTPLSFDSIRRPLKFEPPENAVMP